MKVTTGAAVSEEGGGGSVGHRRRHVVWRTGSVELTHWEGVRTSQTSSVQSPNICLDNEEGEREALSILNTIEKHFTLLNTLLNFI